MRLHRTWLVGLGAGVLLAAGLALAGDAASEYPECNRTPTAADLEGAKGAHKAATQFYERADYDRAIQYWKDAYNFDCTAHGVLINIANAYEKHSNKLGAIKALETYVARAPTAPDVATIQEKVQNLKSSMRTQPPPVPTASASASAVPTAPSPPPTASASAAPPPEGMRPFGYTPLFVAGGGGAVGVVGVILTAAGQSAISDAENLCPDRVNCSQEAADKGNSGRTASTVGGIMIGLGVVGLAGGLVWHFAFNQPAPTDTAAATVRVAPVAGPGYGGIGVSGTF